MNKLGALCKAASFANLQDSFLYSYKDERAAR
jgi:hypothetical protein